MGRLIRSFFVILMALNACQSSAFLLTSECPAPFPCSCSSSSGSRSNIYIDCHSNFLTTIPQIVQYNTTVNSLSVNLDSNRFTIIPNNVFRNLSSINATSIDLRISNNNINTIENDAFNGVENITSLQLENNNLTVIPFVISKLAHLQMLYLTGNPLNSIDPSVMANIGGNLVTLELDLGGFTEWPADLHYLRTLKTLTVKYIPFSHIDTNDFRGFENTLTYLKIYNAKLEKVPHAICRLTHLTGLDFSFDSNLKENRSSIFEPCGNTLPTVKFLYLNGNNLHNFPEVFSLFPSLVMLYAAYNMIQYIENAVILPDAYISFISLSNNLFERIPSALNKLETLENLYLESNKIRTVESADLYGLSNLKTLYLHNNPLAYIEPSAFSHNPSLNYLTLDQTHIGHVPNAVILLSNLRTLMIDQFDCTCEMLYLKHWNVSAVIDFNTKCAYSTVTIKTFVMTSLQSCPDA